MKKEYRLLIKNLNKKNFGKYIFISIIFFIIMMSLFLIPTDCEVLTGSYVNYGDKKLSFKKCRNIYGLEIGLADLND